MQEVSGYVLAVPCSVAGAVPPSEIGCRSGKRQTMQTEVSTAGGDEQV